MSPCTLTSFRFLVSYFIYFNNSNALKATIVQRRGCTNKAASGLANTARERVSGDGVALTIHVYVCGASAKEKERLFLQRVSEAGTQAFK